MSVNKHFSHMDKNEVRISKSSFVKNVFYYCILEIVTLWYSFCYSRNAIIVAVVLPIFCLLFVLEYVNGIIVYDEKGVVFVSVFNKKHFCPWNEIVSVEDTYENPKLVRGSVGRVLKIGYKKYNGEVKYKRYEYKSLAGASEFLNYYLKHKEKEKQ